MRAISRRQSRTLGGTFGSSANLTQSRAYASHSLVEPGMATSHSRTIFFAAEIMLLTETEFHQKMRNIKFLIYFTFPQASLPSMSAQMRWVRGIGVTTVGRHGSQFFALIAPHPEIGGPKSGGAYACECLQQHDAAARRRGRGCATTRFRAQLMPYGRHCGSGLRRLRGTLIHSPPAWRPTGYFNRMPSWIRTRPAGNR